MTSSDVSWVLLHPLRRFSLSTFSAFSPVLLKLKPEKGKRLLSMLFITNRLMSMLDTKHVAFSAFKHAKRIIQFLQGKVSSEQRVKKFLDLGLTKKPTCF